MVWGSVVFLIFWPKIGIGLIAGIGAIFVGIRLPAIYIRSMYEKRCSKAVEDMVDGMTVMANGIKAGLSVTQSMERVVEQC